MGIYNQYRIVAFEPIWTEYEEDQKWIIFANPLKLSSADFVPIYENICLETRIFVFPYESATCLWLRANAEYGKFFWAPIAEDFVTRKKKLNRKSIEAHFHNELFVTINKGNQEWPEFKHDKRCFEYCTETIITDFFGKRNEMWLEHQEYILKNYKAKPLSIHDY